jgi:methionyl-tRNA formyltransferase
MKSDRAGVTIHKLTENFDDGDIIAQDEIPIGDLTADELYDSLEAMGKDLFLYVYKCFLQGTMKSTPQDLTRRHYYPKNMVNFYQAKYVDGLVDRKIRALSFKGKQSPIIKIGDREYSLEVL